MRAEAPEASFGSLRSGNVLSESVRSSGIMQSAKKKPKMPRLNIIGASSIPYKLVPPVKISVRKLSEKEKEQTTKKPEHNFKPKIVIKRSPPKINEHK